MPIGIPENGSNITNITASGTFNVPAKARMAMFVVVGAGGDGGIGAVGASATPFTGSGGGGSGGVTFAQYPASFLPSTLYAFLSAGYPYGGTATKCYISIANDSGGLVAANTLAYANCGETGQIGASGTGGVAGFGGAIASLANMPFGNIGLTLFYAGQGGSPGRYGSAASNVTGRQFTTGGAGGGGCNTVAANQAGGYVTAYATNFPGTAQAAGGGTLGANGTNGQSGYQQFNGMFSWCGGSGGGAIYQGSPSTAQGGNGGNGGYGCGGGGAAPSYSGTAAIGGTGGDPIIYFITW